MPFTSKDRWEQLERRFVRFIGSIDQGRIGKWRDLVCVNNCFPACAAMIATGCIAIDTLCWVPQFLDRMFTGWRGDRLAFPLRLKVTRLCLCLLQFYLPSVSQSIVVLAMGV